MLEVRIVMKSKLKKYRLLAEAVYNSNLPPLQGEARSGGGMGRGGQCRLRDKISIFQSFAALTPTPLPQGEGWFAEL